MPSGLEDMVVAFAMCSASSCHMRNHTVFPIKLYLKKKPSACVVRNILFILEEIFLFSVLTDRTNSQSVLKCVHITHCNYN